jgi:maltoporin
MASQLEDLIAWCKSVVPNDIVMPVGDNKAPRYKHANNSGRGTFARTHATLWAGQRGIVLQDLCVVDIDCMGIDRDERTLS